MGLWWLRRDVRLYRAYLPYRELHRRLITVIQQLLGNESEAGFETTDSFGRLIVRRDAQNQVMAYYYHSFARDEVDEVLSLPERQGVVMDRQVLLLPTNKRELASWWIRPMRLQADEDRWIFEEWEPPDRPLKGSELVTAWETMQLSLDEYRQLIDELSSLH